jgi:hypothetical protein
MIIKNEAKSPFSNCK